MTRECEKEFEAYLSQKIELFKLAKDQQLPLSGAWQNVRKITLVIIDIRTQFRQRCESENLIQ